MQSFIAVLLPLLAAAQSVPSYTLDCSAYSDSHALSTDITNAVNKLQSMGGSASDTSGDGCNRVFYQRDGINEDEGSAVYLCADGGTATVDYSTIGDIVSGILNSCTNGNAEAGENAFVNGVAQVTGYTIEVHHYP